MLYLKVDNGYSMETIFHTVNDLDLMRDMRTKAEALWPDMEIVITTSGAG